MKKSNKLLGAALALGLAATTSANALTAPAVEIDETTVFGAAEVSSPSILISNHDHDHKCGEGKCGEGKCGEGHDDHGHGGHH